MAKSKKKKKNKKKNKPNYEVVENMAKNDNVDKNKPPVGGEISKIETTLYVDQGNGLFLQYNPEELVRRKGYRVLDKMRRDEQVKSALVIKKCATLATGWSVLPAEGEEGSKGDEKVDFINEVFNQMQGTLDKVLWRAMTALDYGFSVAEIVWGVLEEGDFKGKIGIKDIKDKRPHRFEFEVDEFGNLGNKGLVQVQLGERVNLPVNKFVIYSYDKEFGNYYGKSDLVNAYRSWWSKDNLIKFWNIYCEKHGSPLVIGKYNTSNATEISKFKNALKNIQNSTSMSFKQGDFEIDLLSDQKGSGGTQKTAFESALAYHDRGITRSLLVSDMLTEEGSSGAYAKSKTQFDVFLWVVQMLREDLANEVVNEQIIRPLIEMNYGVGVPVPRLVFNPMTEEQKVALLNVWNDAVQKGSVTVVTLDDENEIRKRVGMKPISKEDYEEGKEGDNDDERDDDFLNDIDDDDLDGVDDDTPEGMKANSDKCPKCGEVSHGIMSQFGEDNKKDEYECRHCEPYNYFPVYVKNDDCIISPSLIKQHAQRKSVGGEMRVNFVKVDEDLKRTEDISSKDIQKVLTSQRDKLIAVVQSKYKKKEMTTAFINSLELKFLRDLKKEINTLYREGYLQGQDDGRDELPKKLTVKAEQGIHLDAEDALKYLEDKSTLVVKGINDPLTRDAQGVLYNAVKTGVAVNVVVDQLKEIYNPYLGDGTVIGDKTLKDYRLEAIVRTNLNEAYNEGRKSIAERAGEDFVIGLRYSEILDDRTTDISKAVDGKVIKIDSPQLASLSYPLHWNERGVFTYVTVDDEDVVFMDEAQIATLIAQKGI